VNWLDWVIALIVIASVFSGLRTGFARAAIGTVALLVGIVAGLWLYGSAGGWLRDYVSHKSVANLLGFCLVFFAVIGTGVAAGHLLAKLFKWVGLGWLDRLMGGALGLLRGTLFAMVLILALCAFSRQPPPAAVATSRFAPYIIDASSLMASVAPRELKDGFDESYRRVKKLWEEMWKKAGSLPVQEL
jgi:membrane protein required for colicin V production